MSSTSVAAKSGLLRFRIRLLAAMMLVVSAITALGLYLAQRQLEANVERALEREFRGEVTSLHRVQEMHRAALRARCRALAEKPRIHAALEDGALDLLYPNAQEELRDIMNLNEESSDGEASGLHAIFYRFLDGRGRVITPPNPKEFGELRSEEESELTLDRVPAEEQIGYLRRKTDDGSETIDEVIAMPIISSETNEPIAAIAVGVEPVAPGRDRAGANIGSGIWLKGRLHLPSLPGSAQAMMLDAGLTRAIAPLDQAGRSLRVEVNGGPNILFYDLLNPNSLFPPAYEVCIYPLNDLLARQRQLRWQIVGAGALLLLVAFSVSHIASARLSEPVTRLAHESAEEHAERERVEAKLEKTSEELQRSARFSADTSHQLKTPVTVLRAGLEELRAHENLTPEGREEIAALIHQTFRITSIIEDLLLLAQVDAGRLQIAFSSVDLSHLIDAQMDDLSAQPDGVDAEMNNDCGDVHIAGEKHYVALILQNLLENARKYNRPGGRIRLACREEGDWAILTIGNTGRSIPGPARAHIFERFHRGSVGEDIAGHGLGLNLARELARLHGGDLRLVCSEEDWTEFEVRFRLARQIAAIRADVS